MLYTVATLYMHIAMSKIYSGINQTVVSDDIWRDNECVQILPEGIDLNK